MKEKENLNKEKEQKQKKKGFVAWWGGLTNPIKGLIIGGTTVALASAIVFPTLAATIWKKPSIETINFTPLTQEGTKYLITNKLNVKKDIQYKFYANNLTDLISGKSSRNFALYFAEEMTASTFYKFKVNNMSTNKNKFKEVEFDEGGSFNKYEFSYVNMSHEGNKPVYVINEQSFNNSENELNITVTFNDDSISGYMVLFEA